MRELFLHVGMHKTGTSSIQQTLHAAANLLQQHGYSWLDTGDPNHSGVVYSAFTEMPHLYHVNRRKGLHDPTDAARHAEACRAQLAAFLAQAPGPRLILSGESIGVLRQPGIGRMLAAFRPLVDRITVIGFVRPPRSYLESAAQQRIMGGETLDGLRRRPVVPRYRERFAPFLAAPEVTEVRLHRFTPEALHQGCSVATFLRLIGAPDTLYPALSVVRANAGGSHLGRVLALAANEVVPMFGPDGGPNPERAERLARFLDRLPGPRFAVPGDIVAAGLAACAEDIAWMEDRLGAPFADAEKAAPAGGAESGPRPFHQEELHTLVLAINRLIAEGWTRRQDRFGAAPAGPGLPRPEPSPGQLARRAERRRLRQQQP